MRRIATAALAAAVAGVTPGTASAFCGFYVSGAGAELFNNATQVVLMREGTRTVLSMQNNYQGPPEDFAMVVPVPMVLQEENVKTLDRGIFARVDQLAAPRLVEYWEEDPCAPQVEYAAVESGVLWAPQPSAPRGAGRDLGVTIEAQFTVGEYEIVILGARDSAGLDAWLRQNRYQIPQGAEPLLRPYVQSGMKFFVAKVNAGKVRFEKGMAMLSPLRFHYDSEELALPVRLGMMNSAGTQDLIVHILARGQRYEAANYRNVTIPTNLDVQAAARERFGELYAALFDRTLEVHPGAVVTEYAWDTATCDPCPTPPLTPQELASLGHDVLHAPAAGKAPRPRGTASWPGDFVLTRLHMRYGKDALADDLVFRAAPPIVGGREMPGPDGALEQGATLAGYNSFQARYAIRHAWTGAIECKSPRRGQWGGPPPGVQGAGGPRAATELAFAPRGAVQLASLMAQPIPELKVTPGADGTPGMPGPSASRTPAPPAKQSKGCQAGPGAGSAAAWLAVLGLGLFRRRPRRRPARPTARRDARCRAA